MVERQRIRPMDGGRKLLIRTSNCDKDHAEVRIRPHGAASARFHTAIGNSVHAVPVDAQKLGAINLSDRSLVQQEAFLDLLEALQDVPSEAELAFFADRRLRGLGVGMDLEGRLVFEVPACGP